MQSNEKLIKIKFFAAKIFNEGRFYIPIYRCLFFIFSLNNYGFETYP